MELGLELNELLDIGLEAGLKVEVRSVFAGCGFAAMELGIELNELLDIRLVVLAVDNESFSPTDMHCSHDAAP